jgi:hypothetical protein
MPTSHARRKPSDAHAQRLRVESDTCACSRSASPPPCLSSTMAFALRSALRTVGPARVGHAHTRLSHPPIARVQPHGTDAHDAWRACIAACVRRPCARQCPKWRRLAPSTCPRSPQRAQRWTRSRSRRRAPRTPKTTASSTTRRVRRGVPAGRAPAARFILYPHGERHKAPRCRPCARAQCRMGRVMCTRGHACTGGVCWAW